MEITKGKWTANAFGVRTNDMEIADCVLGNVRQPGMTITEAQANADFISAAPDCYEGLKDALREICRMCVRLNPQHKDCTSCEEMERSRLPLLKAEGK